MGQMLLGVLFIFLGVLVDKVITALGGLLKLAGYSPCSS